jgi:23S rRNA G2445 N2-methylase RlmL
LGNHVETMVRSAPSDLFAARTWMTFGFPLGPVPASPDDPARAIVTSITSAEAQAILRRFTKGPLRYRISFAGGGKRRSVVWRIAVEAQGRVADLVNDPAGSAWEAVVHENGALVQVELVPRSADARFAYRVGDVPAASHPTIAAALIRAAGPNPAEVAWDPFAGSGTELCERALAGSYLSLVGSDHDARVLEVARANLEACGARAVTLLEGDATRLVPPGAAPTLIVTNPPLGRRVQRSAALGPLLDRFIAHAARVLAPGGRVAWISPFPERTRESAERAGLRMARALDVDMGGFTAELQVLRR